MANKKFKDGNTLDSSQVYDNIGQQVLQDYLYYKPGDREVINEWYGAGFITNSGTSIRITIPLPKDTSNISKASITLGNINIRSIEGTYLELELKLPNDKVKIKYLRKRYVTIYIDGNSAYNTKNNTPVGVQFDSLNIQFS